MCNRVAEWVIWDRDPYSETYTCTKHLSQMVADTTVSIEPYNDSVEKCCYLLHLPRCLWFMFKFLIHREGKCFT